MSAAVIAFPARRRAPTPVQAQATFYGALGEYAAARARAMLAEAKPARPSAEDEILKLLRRIDRRLARQHYNTPALVE